MDRGNVSLLAPTLPGCTGVLMAGIFHVLGCSADLEPQPSPTVQPGAVGRVNQLGRPRCTAPAANGGSPETIEQAILLLDALPKPTSVACFLESLDRPLYAFATSSSFSAQPAFSRRSPRVFLKKNQLIISAVIEGDSSYLVEFSYLLEGDRSTKGELHFPITEPVQASAPYDRVLFDGGTVCRTCHGREERVVDMTFASVYSSDAFRPNPNYQVKLDFLAQEAQACDFANQPARCEMLSAIFDGGPVHDAEFPETMKVFF